MLLKIKYLQNENNTKICHLKRFSFNYNLFTTHSKFNNANGHLCFLKLVLVGLEWTCITVPHIPLEYCPILLSQLIKAHPHSLNIFFRLCLSILTTCSR